MRTRPMSAGDVQRRAQQAKAFLDIAELALTDLSTPGHSNVAGSNAVLAGIAAADAICGHARGERSASDSHDDAVELVKLSSPPGSSAAAQLKRLVAAKTDTQYSANLVSAAAARALVLAAQRLVTEMDKALRL